MNLENDIISSSSSNASEAGDALSLSCDDFAPSFQDRFASCVVENNLTHVQGNSVLHLLRTYPCFSNLPKDIRTCLHTPQNRAVVYKVEPGEYVHFDLEKEIIECLSNASIASIRTGLQLDFNTDGGALYRSSNNHIWPIQCRVSNVQGTKPIIVGIYKGKQKPLNPNTFFEKFIEDIRRIMSNGGINFHGNNVATIQLRCFIADAPARAFILNHRGHMSCQPCSKCKVTGVLSEGRYVFSGVSHSLRTDEEYIRCLDEDHHKEVTSPLSLLPIGMVSQVPFEYIHLVCLGVMKKLLSAWIHGKYLRMSKLSGRSISLICARLEILKQYCPSDFARRLRSLHEFAKYKATEFRQFLAYTGPVVIYGLLNEQLYKHFLFLHSAIRILLSKCPSQQHLNFAELALQKFVLRSENFYGCTFQSYNVHGLFYISPMMLDVLGI